MEILLHLIAPNVAIVQFGINENEAEPHHNQNGCSRGSEADNCHAE